MINIYSKKLSTPLTLGLSLGEVRCKCTRKACRMTLVSDDLLIHYYALRKEIGGPLAITSGYRCQAHNFKVGGAPLSQHCMGNALDILCPVQFTVDEFAEMAKDAGFSFIKKYHNRIHADVRRLIN